MKQRFLGLRTVCYAAPDLDVTKNWYIRALGIEPYFDQPFYVGFNVGGYELGLDPDAPSGGPGTQVFWGVENIEETVQYLQAIGATLDGEIQEVGDNIKVATMIDPFGNHLGVIYNPHFSLPG